jgi:hypothetical protein
MTIAKVLAAFAATLMFALIAWASVTGQFGPEGSALFALAWGKVTLADLYVGFALFSGWVIFRQESLLLALVFVALEMTLGNAFAAVYVLVALVRSKGDWRRFWLGARFTNEGDKTQ